MCHPDSRTWVYIRIVASRSINGFNFNLNLNLSAILSQQGPPSNLSCGGNQHCLLTSPWCHCIFYKPIWGTLHTRLSCSGESKPSKVHGLLLAARRPLNTLCWPAFAAAIRSAATKQRRPALCAFVVFLMRIHLHEIGTVSQWVSYNT